VQKLARNLVMKIVNKIQARTGVRIVVLAENEADTRKQLEEGKFDAVLTFGPDFFTRFQDVAPEDLIAPSRGKLADGLTALDLHLEHNPGKGENTRSLVEQFVWGCDSGGSYREEHFGGRRLDSRKVTLYFRPRNACRP